MQQGTTEAKLNARKGVADRREQRRCSKIFCKKMSLMHLHLLSLLLFPFSLSPLALAACVSPLLCPALSKPLLALTCPYGSVRICAVISLAPPSSH